MNRKKGYFVLELSVSLVITSITIIILYSLLLSSISMYEKIYSSIEIQQQGLEIQKHIEDELKEGSEIVNIKTEDNQIINSENFEFKNVKSIKYRPNDRLDDNELDELFLNKKTKKVFVKRKNYNSGYEIGDYVDNIYIAKEKSGKILNIKLELSKNKQNQCIEFSIYKDDMNMGECI